LPLNGRLAIPTLAGGQTGVVAHLVRNGVVLAYEEAGRGDPPLVFVHGIACHRGFWAPQVRYFASDHRVLAVDLRGHGGSDAPEQPYTIRGFAEDLAWTCARLEIPRPIVVGHSLGGLVALEFAAADAEQAGGVVLIDSVLLPGGERSDAVHALVAALRTSDADRALRNYFATFFGPDDDPTQRTWILDQAVRTPPHVTSSVWEESLRSWDDAGALRRCGVPVLYLDAGTPNADLAQAAELCPELVVGRTIGSGHFSPLEVPEQINAMIERFVAVTSTADRASSG
jgi:pimeloyl-ACP methyl ester carboxylesterase